MEEVVSVDNSLVSDPINSARQKDTTRKKKSGLTIILVSLGFVFIILLVSVGLLIYKLLISKNNPNSEPIITEKPIETSVDEPVEIPEPTPSPTPKPSLSTDNAYPFELPVDAPFTFLEMEEYYNEADERFYVRYTESKDNTEEAFIAEIEPYVKYYLASTEYMLQKYNDVFQGDSPKLDDREMLTINVVEECLDANSSLTESTCDDLKMIASASPFTLSVTFFINFDHKDFHPDLILDVATHEAVHILQYTYQEGIPGSIMPDWFKESMAEGLSYISARKKSLNDELLARVDGFPETLEDLENWINADYTAEGGFDKVRISYYYADGFFDHLIKKTTLEKYLSLISVSKDSYNHEGEFYKSFAKMFGKSPELMYKEYATTL